ncbi:MAG: thermopsin family protease, partial [Thermoplasmata archaeon]
MVFRTAENVASEFGPTAAVAQHLAAQTAVAPTKALADPSLARIGPTMAPTKGNAHVTSMQPGCLSAPCPMGVADYGLTSTGGTYTENPFIVSSFLDIAELGIGVANGGGCLDPNAESGVCFTIQQNAVLHHVYVENNLGSYWTQNVPEIAYDPSCSSPCVSGTYSLTWLDNIWNFSYSGGVCPSDTDSGKGCINPSNIVGNYAGGCLYSGGQPEFYYCVGPTTYDLLPPFTVWTWTDVDTYGPCAASSAFACVNFYGAIAQNGGLLFGGYYDGVSFYAGSHSAAMAQYYVHDSDSPLGLPYDFEWVAGGPGGGSSNSVLILGT